VGAAEAVLGLGTLALVLGGLGLYQWFCARMDEAKEARYRRWVRERERILAELEGEEPPEPERPLTDITGVGAQTAQHLKQAGFETVESIADADVRRLSRVPGFKAKRARAVIREARALLDAPR